MKTAFITGASAGIGAATAKQLLKDGYRVYAAARRVDRMAELAALGARLIRFDLADDNSIVAAMTTIRTEERRLDVLINNAGYGLFGAVEDVPMAQVRQQFEVNFFGHARLTQLAVPMMRKQMAGSIVNVSGAALNRGHSFAGMYNASKMAIEGLSASLQSELRPFGIHVFVVQPDKVKTQWHDIARQNLVQFSSATDYGLAAAERVLAMENSLHMTDAESVAFEISGLLTAQDRQDANVIASVA